MVLFLNIYIAYMQMDNFFNRCIFKVEYYSNIKYYFLFMG